MAYWPRQGCTGFIRDSEALRVQTAGEGWTGVAVRTGPACRLPSARCMLSLIAFTFSLLVGNGAHGSLH